MYHHSIDPKKNGLYKVWTSTSSIIGRCGYPRLFFGVILGRKRDRFSVSFLLGVFCLLRIFCLWDEVNFWWLFWYRVEGGYGRFWLTPGFYRWEWSYIISERELRMLRPPLALVCPLYLKTRTVHHCSSVRRRRDPTISPPDHFPVPKVVVGHHCSVRIGKVCSFVVIFASPLGLESRDGSSVFPIGRNLQLLTSHLLS